MPRSCSRSRSLHPPENAFPEGAFTISVRDTGPGIAAKELPFIFDRFRQVDSSSKKFYSGTGIGLALVKEFTELHHGSVSVKSEEGFGSEFVIKLPLGREIFSEEGAVFLDEATDEEVSSDLVLPEEPPAPLVAPEHSAQSETLLIVEDNAEVRAFVRNCIEGAFVIVEAEDGVEGLEKAHHEIPDLIISDLYMPNMDGNAFTEKIKQDPELGHIPLIILTSSQEQESLIEGLTHGADVYMKKPFYANELNIRIRNLLQNRNRVREHARRQLLMSDASTQPVAAHQPFLQKAIETVKAHLKDQFFNVDAFAEAMAKSPRQLQRLLKQHTGESPARFIMLMRLKEAAAMLKKGTAFSIKELANEVGFKNDSHFMTRFREVYGMTPTEFMGSNRKSPEAVAD